MTRRRGAGVHAHDAHYHAGMLRYGRRTGARRRCDEGALPVSIGIIVASVAIALLAMALEAMR